MDEFEYGDTKEQIENCLNCTKKKCTNCIARSEEAKEQRRLLKELEFDKSKVLTLYNSDMSDVEIGEIMKCNRKKVLAWRKANGLVANRYKGNKRGGE